MSRDARADAGHDAGRDAGYDAGADASYDAAAARDAGSDDAGAGKGCGGWLGNTCTDSEYCAYVPGQLCGAGDASAACKPRPQICSQIYAPVCGCDRKAYSNECAAAAAGMGVYSTGKCP
jgi:hypothetical protein